MGQFEQGNFPCPTVPLSKGPGQWDSEDHEMRTATKSRKSYIGAARDIWPKAEWIIGNGPYASVSECHDRPTVMLFETMAEAATSKQFIDRSACGGRCIRAHRVVSLRGVRADG